MKKFLTLITVAAMAFAAHANEWTAAEGTNLAEYAPVYGYNNDMTQHNQMQYPAAELGMTAGTEITAMKFYTSTIDLVNAMGGTFKVSLANMVDVSPWVADAWGDVSGDLLNVDVTTVAATVTPAADADGVWTITFDTPFTYTGAALLVDFETINSGSWKETRFYGKEMDAYYAMSSYGYAGSKKPDSVLPKVTFIYEGGGSQDEGITLLSEANALEDAAQFTFNGDAVVTACKNGYVFLRDESGYGMIAGVTGAAFENGQVLGQGWTATKTSVNSGWVRYTNAAGLSYSGENNAELAAPQELMTKPTDDSMLNAYVLIRNTTISSGGGGGFPGLPGHAVQYTLPDGTTIGETQTLWSFDGEAGSDLYNVYGIVCKVSGTYKIQPVIFEKIEEPQPTVERGNVNGIGGVDMDDLTALINYMLDPVNTEINQANAAACNSLDSNEVNMDDLTALINFMMTGAWAD